MDIRYRHEWKYELNYMDFLCIRQRLKAVAEPDPHAAGGIYQIRSLYFDNIFDKALREKIDGVNMREKFRIRYYNGDPAALIHLEKKSKKNGLGTKYSAELSIEETEKIMRGDIQWMLSSPQPLIREFYSKILSQGLRPAAVVEYTREPYIYRPGNVRVTFDYDLRTSLGTEGFLDPDSVTIPAGDAPFLMEVKWDDFLPGIIQDAVRTPGRRVGAFSKYAQCRIYG